MALSFFIQEGVVSTGKKTSGSIAQLFNVTRWLKFALTSLGVSYYDPCEPTCLPTQGSTIGVWADEASRPATTAGVPVIGWNLDTGALDIWTGSAWTSILP